jgi:hypothetical protein
MNFIVFSGLLGESDARAERRLPAGLVLFGADVGWGGESGLAHDLLLGRRLGLADRQP